jgi:glycosyltransferase involved in cell wall biosynthesis
LHIAGYETIGARGYVARLLQRAAELGLGDRVTALPAMPREQLLRRAAQCDMGLSLMPATNANSNERRMAGASNKAFEYLASGVPLIVSDLPDWTRLFVDAGVAWACDPDNIDDMVALLDRAIREREQVLQMGRRGRELVRTRWNYETQFAPVLGAMREARVIGGVRVGGAAA